MPSRFRRTSGFPSGLQFTASYTYSHALDEQSGLGLFVTGNNALVPRTDYASADFDQTHVFLINYSYTIPTFVKDNKALGYAVNGWTIGGQTVAQSGQPYSVYDYSGSVGSLYYGTYDDIGNPIVPLTGAIKTKQAELQGTLGVNPATPVLNASDFDPVFVQPGTVRRSPLRRQRVRHLRIGVRHHGTKHLPRPLPVAF